MEDNFRHKKETRRRRQRQSRRYNNDKRNGTHHLDGKHAHGLDGELAVAHVEELLEVRTQEVDDEHVVQPLLPEVVHLRNPFEPGERLVGTILVAELGRVGLAGFLEMDMRRTDVVSERKEKKERQRRTNLTATGRRLCGKRSSPAERKMSSFVQKQHSKK